jgi:hypothetical protein
MSQQRSKDANSSILERFKEMEASYGYSWDEANNQPRRLGQTHRYIDEPFEDSSTAQPKEPKEHGDLCFCKDCLS